jgi:hypothetical protein
VTIEQSYQNQITDEFIDPIVMVDAVDQPVYKKMMLLFSLILEPTEDVN